MNERRKAQLLATLLAPIIPDALRLEEPPSPEWMQVLPLNDELIVIPVIHETRHLARAILPASLLALLCGDGTMSQDAESKVLEKKQIKDLQVRLERSLSERTSLSRPFLWSLLTSDRREFRRLLRQQERSSRESASSPDGREGRVRRKLREAMSRFLRRQEATPTRPRLMAAWVSRQVIAGILNGIIALVLAAALFIHFGWNFDKWWSIGLLKVFAIWSTSFLPGWLFVRFLGQRARALWWDFVLALHRLGVDQSQFLPEPPLNSQYYREWRESGGSSLSACDSIYREKFDAYYGKQVSNMAANSQTTKIWSETLFPVILLTAVLAVGWTSVLWDTSFASSPDGPSDMLKFGFLGAYAFIVQMLVRRYFQSDLRASAYASAVVRVFVVEITVVVIYQIPGLRDKPIEEAVVAFVVGFFPIVGMQALQRLAAAVLRQAVPSLNPAYPLDQIDGLNVWYEARLIEEGIEDMQNLTTTNLVDVLLHTHVPVGRLVDWIDQAHLYQHLDRTELSGRERRKAVKRRKPAKRTKGVGTPESVIPAVTEASDNGQQVVNKESREEEEGFRFGTREKHELRRLGIRTATDLLKVMPSPLSEHDRTWLEKRKLDPYAMEKLVATLRKEPGLQVILRWQRGVDVGACDWREWATP